MIFVDFHGHIISNIFGYSAFVKTGVFDKKDFIEKYLVKLGRLAQKYKKEYGEFVIAADSSKRKYWRTLEFEHYKAARYIEEPEDSLTPKDLETKEMLKTLPREIFDIIDEHFPWKIIRTGPAEADDIIATLINYNYSDKHLIISKDGDFKQLQRHSGVTQIDYHGKKIISKNPAEELFDKVIRGDSGDGIPNILSDDDTLVIEGKRQTPMTEKKIAYINSLDFEKMREDPETKDDKIVLRYFQNKMLIDLSETPLELKEEILRLYTEYSKTSNKVMSYCLKNKFATLFENISLY